MKTILTIILLFVIVLPCSGFTPQELEQMGQIFDKKLEPLAKEITEIKIEMAEMKGKMATKDDIIEVRKDFTREMHNLRSEMRNANDGTNDRIDALYEASIVVWAAIVIAILAAIFGGPLFNKWLERREERKNAMVEMREMARELAKSQPEWVEAYRSIGLL